MLVLFYDGIFSNQAIQKILANTNGLLRNFFEIALWHECSPEN